MIAWFHGEFGFDEEAVLDGKGGFDAVRDKFKLELLDGEVILESKENSARFHVGKFEVPSVRTLRQRLKGLVESGQKTPERSPSEEPKEGQAAGDRDPAEAAAERRRNYIESRVDSRLGSSRELLRQGSSADRGNVALTFFNVSGDAREYHLDPANRDAVFQVASQFNCLEMVDPSEQPEHGITQYAMDKTQGPACAMACPAATVFRNYFLPVDHLQSPDGSIQEWKGQAGGSEKQLDTTCEVAELVNNREKQYWKMQNGYLLPERRAMRSLTDQMGVKVALGDESMTLREAIAQCMRVGVHWSTQTARFREVSTPSRRSASPTNRLRKEAEELPAHCVCQVLCSAVPVAYDHVTKPEEWEPFACAVLDAQYEATLAVAALLSLERKKRVRVYLTSVGGGAFENKTEWIVRAVEKAVERHKEHQLDVRMVHYVMPQKNPFAALEKQYSQYSSGPYTAGAAQIGHRRLSGGPAPPRSRFQRQGTETRL